MTDTLTRRVSCQWCGCWVPAHGKCCDKRDAEALRACAGLADPERDVARAFSLLKEAREDLALWHEEHECGQTTKCDGKCSTCETIEGIDAILAGQPAPKAPPERDVAELVAALERLLNERAQGDYITVEAWRKARAAVDRART